MAAEPRFLISLGSSPASDSWGFVGTVSVGDQEIYRTLLAHSTPQEALAATQALVGRVLGGLLAGEEWRESEQQLGHPPRRTDLSFGLEGLGPPETEPPPE
jgi:hypothetical protein